MNKKSKIIVIGSIIFILGGVLLSIGIAKNTKNTDNAKNTENTENTSNTDNTNKIISEEEEIQVEPKAREKADDALIEDTARNFRNIYVSLVNDKELDFSFLNNVITKDSNIYKEVVEDIKTKRNLNTKLEEQNVDIKEIKELKELKELKGLTEGYEVVATITYTETAGENTKVIELEQIFKVSVQDNNIRITELK